MRGGRGGRGRGRFGGRGSATQDLIRDNMEDLGMDSFHTMDDRTPPPLYPPIAIPVPTAPTEEEQYCIRKMRELSYRFKSSPYFLSRKVEQKDIQRYSDKYRGQESNLTLFDCINTSAEDASRYIPFELLDGSVLGSRSGAVGVGADELASNLDKRKGELNLQKLEMAEAGGGPSGRGRQETKKEDDSDIEDGKFDEMDEFEMEDDYIVDHYASDDGGGGDDDGEAVF